MPNTPATWLDAVTVNTTTAGTRADARVTVLSNGNILITWTATTQAPGEPAVSNIVGQILDPLGNPVNGEFIINVGSEGHLAGNSDIQATADGGFFAVFERNQAGLEDVLIIRFDASGTPSPSGNLFFDVTLSGANPSGFDPQVAVASETSGLAVWRETTETGRASFAALSLTPRARLLPRLMIPTCSTSRRMPASRASLRSSLWQTEVMRSLSLP